MNISTKKKDKNSKKIKDTQTRQTQEYGQIIKMQEENTKKLRSRTMRIMREDENPEPAAKTSKEKNHKKIIENTGNIDI